MKFWKGFLPVGFLFVLVTILILLSRGVLAQYGFNVPVLLWGNFFLFVLSFISFLIQLQGIKASAAPQLFIRYFYISFLIKFLLVATVVLLYATLGGKVNRISIITCMALYLVYMFIELRMVLKSGKSK